MNIKLEESVVTRLSRSDSNKQLLWREFGVRLKEGRFSFAFLRQNLYIFLFLVGYFRRVFYRERFIQIFEMFQHFLHFFFHVNHEGIINMDRTNTVFEVFLHFLQYALDVLWVLR